VRRFTYRVDGFASANAGDKGGELLTKSLTFEGKSLSINFQTSESGSVAVELQDENGRPIPGFTLADAKPLSGDSLDQTVRWKADADLGKLAGKTIRLRFRLKNADVYSLQFSR
jgi:hypothetical protein